MVVYSCCFVNHLNSEMIIITIFAMLFVDQSAILTMSL